MKPLLQVFWYELSRSIRRKGFLFSTFGIPVIAFVILFGIQAISSLDLGGGGEEEAQEFEGLNSAGYVDQAGMFSDVDDVPRVFTYYESVEAAQQALDAGDIQLYYVIEPDYMETGEVSLYVPSLSVNLFTTRPIRQVIYSRLSEEVDGDLFERLVTPSNIEVIAPDPDSAAAQQPAGPQDFDTSFILVYVFTVGLMISLFMTNGYLMQGVIEEKESRVVEILISTLRPVQLLSGKILAFGLLGILQMLVWLGAFILILQFADILEAISVLASIVLPLDVLPLILLYFVLAYLFFATAYGIVGAISTSMQEGPQFAVIFTLPAVIPLYFLGVFIESPNATLPVVLSMIPVTSPLAMTERLLLTSVPAEQILISVGLMVVTIIFMMWLAGRMFRVQTLLAGQTPRLRDIPRLIRG